MRASPYDASVPLGRPALEQLARGLSAPRPQQQSHPQQREAELLEAPGSQQRALENLLRTVAEKAAHMDAEAIRALTVAFTAAADGGGLAPAAAPAAAQDSRASVYRWSAGEEDGTQGGQVVHYQADGQAQAASALPTLAEVIGSLQTVKVSAKTNVKSIAGAMSKALRGSEAFVATAVGGEGVNHGMKAMCIARCYLAAEGLDLTATLTEVKPDAGISSGQCYAFIVVRMVVEAKQDPWASEGVGRTEPHPRFMRPQGQQTDMKVAGAGMAAPVGGAIAKCVREDREVIITSVGPASVAKCVEALALARSYLRPDGIELFFFPGFERIVMQGTGPGAGEERSCVRVHAWAEASMV